MFATKWCVRGLRVLEFKRRLGRWTGFEEFLACEFECGY
jgi:hypothetical protein